MRRLPRYLLLILCTLALVGGSTISFAASITSAPCAHDHSHQTGGTPAHHDHHAGCLSCCLGACTAIPDLPPRVSLGAAVFSGMPVTYWETGVSLSDRSIPPDPGPPRTTV
jgi:hypothetical protein